MLEDKTSNLVRQLAAAEKKKELAAVVEQKAIQRSQELLSSAKTMEQAFAEVVRLRKDLIATLEKANTLMEFVSKAGNMHPDKLGKYVDAQLQKTAKPSAAYHGGPTPSARASRRLRMLASRGAGMDQDPAMMVKVPVEESHATSALARAICKGLPQQGLGAIAVLDSGATGNFLAAGTPRTESTDL